VRKTIPALPSSVSSVSTVSTVSSDVATKTRPVRVEDAHADARRIKREDVSRAPVEHGHRRAEIDGRGAHEGARALVDGVDGVVRRVGDKDVPRPRVGQQTARRVPDRDGPDGAVVAAGRQCRAKDQRQRRQDCRPYHNASSHVALLQSLIGRLSGQGTHGGLSFDTIKGSS